MADESFVLRCGHCGNTTAFNERAEYHFDDYANYEMHGLIARVEWRILQCPACKEPTLHQTVGFATEKGRVFYDEDSASVLFPVEKSLAKELPEDVAMTYRDALHLAPVSPGACAVMMGRTLEVICRQQGAISSNDCCTWQTLTAFQIL